MANSYTSYTSNGSQTEFNVTFPYLSRDHVSVLVDGELLDEADYSWTSATTIDLDTAAANGLEVKIKRTTPSDERLVGFENGSTLDANTDLDTDSDQWLYLVQELAEGAALDVSGVALTASNLADNAVTTPKIAAGAVTAAKLAATAVTPGSYVAASITVDAQGRLTAAASTTPFNGEDAQDAVADALTDTDTISFDYVDGSNRITADVNPLSITTGLLADDSVTQSKIAANSVGTSELINESVTIDKLALLPGIALSTFKVAGAASLLPNVGPVLTHDHMYVGNYKTDLKTGYIANLSPSGPAGSNYMRRQYVQSIDSILIFSSTTYVLYDVGADTYSAARNAPAHWNQLGADYSTFDGHLYFCDTSRASKQDSLIEFSTETRGNAFTSNCINVKVCGATGEYLLAIENATPAKVHRYDTTAFGALGPNVTLSGVLASGCHMCLTTAGKVIVPDTDGKLQAIDPATMVATPVVLSGVSGRITYDTYYDATHNLIFAVDADAKIWVLNGTTFAVLTAFYGPSAAAGLCFDPTNRILWATLPAGPNVYRYQL